MGHIDVLLLLLVVACMVSITLARSGPDRYDLRGGNSLEERGQSYRPTKTYSKRKKTSPVVYEKKKKIVESTPPGRNSRKKKPVEPERHRVSLELPYQKADSLENYNYKVNEVKDDGNDYFGDYPAKVYDYKPPTSLDGKTGGPIESICKYWELMNMFPQAFPFITKIKASLNSVTSNSSSSSTSNSNNGSKNPKRSTGNNGHGDVKSGVSTEKPVEQNKAVEESPGFTSKLKNVFSKAATEAVSMFNDWWGSNTDPSDVVANQNNYESPLMDEALEDRNEREADENDYDNLQNLFPELFDSYGEEDDYDYEEKETDKGLVTPTTTKSTPMPDSKSNTKGEISLVPEPVLNTMISNHQVSRDNNYATHWNLGIGTDIQQSTVANNDIPKNNTYVKIIPNKSIELHEKTLHGIAHTERVPQSSDTNKLQETPAKLKLSTPDNGSIKIEDVHTQIMELKPKHTAGDTHQISPKTKPLRKDSYEENYNNNKLNAKPRQQVATESTTSGEHKIYNNDYKVYQGDKPIAIDRRKHQTHSRIQSKSRYLSNSDIHDKRNDYRRRGSYRKPIYSDENYFDTLEEDYDYLYVPKYRKRQRHNYPNTAHSEFEDYISKKFRDSERYRDSSDAYEDVDYPENEKTMYSNEDGGRIYRRKKEVLEEYNSNEPSVEIHKHDKHRRRTSSTSIGRKKNVLEENKSNEPSVEVHKHDKHRRRPSSTSIGRKKSSPIIIIAHPGLLGSSRRRSRTRTPPVGEKQHYSGEEDKEEENSKYESDQGSDGLESVVRMVEENLSKLAQADYQEYDEVDDERSTELLRAPYIRKRHLL